MLKIGERLREERARLGLNQADLAAIGGVAKTSQFNYEKGDRSPDADYLAAVAEKGVDVLYVVTGQRALAQGEGFTAEEAQLVDRYRIMPAEARATLESVSEALATFKPKG